MHKAAWDQRSTGLQQGQKQKETSKGTNLSTPLHYQGCSLLFLHLIIPLTLSKGLLFCGYNCNISGVWETVSTRGRRNDCSSLSLSSIDLVGAQMEIIGWRLKCPFEIFQ